MGINALQCSIAFKCSSVYVVPMLSRSRRGRRKPERDGGVLSADLDRLGRTALSSKTIDDRCAGARVADRALFSICTSQQETIRSLADARLRNPEDLMAVRTCNPTPRCLTGADRLAFSDEPYRALVGATMSSCGKALGMRRGTSNISRDAQRVRGHWTRHPSDDRSRSP
jgi:hypothetical protein